MVGDPVRLYKSVQPEAVTTGFIATHHRGAFGQAKALFGLGDFLQHAPLIARGDAPLAGFLTMP